MHKATSALLRFTWVCGEEAEKVAVKVKMLKNNIMTSFDNVLYIIGNGFDLHHGVLSSYRSFSLWLQRKNRVLYEKLNDVCMADYLWRDFEGALPYVDRNFFLGMGDLLLPQGWTEDDGYAELFMPQDYVREEAEMLWDDIVKWFRKWVLSISWHDGYDKKKVMLDDQARYITFNYTPFLETQYGIPEENILYIHGRRADRKHPPIIGHDGRDTFDEWYERAPRPLKRHYRGKHSMLPEVEMMTESVETFYSLSEKPVERILRENQAFFDDLYDVEYIYVLGHSLGNVDLPYFRAINQANDYPERLSWKVSYYSEEEKTKLERIMREMIDENASLEMLTMTDLQRVR